MATQANISKFKFRLGDGASPEVFTAVEEVFSISGFGKNNDLLDVTNFDSPAQTREFIAGLADGAEITVDANYVPGATQQTALKADVDAGNTENFQIAYTGSSPEETFNFAGVCLSWNITPSPTEQNQISFTVKISGDIT